MCRSGAAWLVVALAAGNVWAQASAPQSTRSLTDGVYTVDQAERGRTYYLANCASCHGESLRGGRFFRDEPVPELRRDTLFEGWSNLQEFYESLRGAMPADEPASLEAQEYIDVLAYLLSVNDFPAGRGELPTDAAQLQRITVGRRAR